MSRIQYSSSLNFITWRTPNVFIWNVLLHRQSSSLVLLEFCWNWDTSSFPSSTHLLSALTKLAAVRGLNFSFSSKHSNELASAAFIIFWSRADWIQLCSFSSGSGSCDLICWIWGAGTVPVVDENLAGWCSNILLFVIRTRHSLREGSPRNIM